MNITLYISVLCIFQLFYQTDLWYFSTCEYYIASLNVTHMLFTGPAVVKADILKDECVEEQNR